MNKVKQLLRRLLAGESQNSITKELGIHKRTIRSYKALIDAAGLTLEQALALSDEAMTQLINECKPRETTCAGKRHAVLESKMTYYSTELKKTGVTVFLLWEEYKAENPDGYEYSQFASHVARYRHRDKLTMHLDHTPGQYLQLDFAGDKHHYIDETTGELVPCEVLVATLPFSGCSWALALPSQKQTDFVAGVNWILKQLKSLPQALKIDNLKSGVITSDRYEPTFNDLLGQLAEHYGLVLKTARVRKPKDKPSVENAVCQTYRTAYARLRHQDFFSLKELNIAIVQEMDTFNRKNFQGREYSRYDLLQEEIKQMSPLTDHLFELIQQSSAKVQNDYHVYLGVDKHKYSVPYTYYKQQVSIQFTQDLVRIYNSRNECIATHARVRSAYKHSTLKEHMPPHHKAYSEQLQWSGTYYVNQAALLGEHTKDYMQKLLKSKPYEQLSYDSCKGLLSLKRHYTCDQIEQACKQLTHTDIKSYKPVKNVLEKWENETAGDGDPLLPSASSTKTPHQHDNLR